MFGGEVEEYLYMMAWWQLQDEAKFVAIILEFYC